MITTVNDFTLFIVVISISFLIMSVCLVVVVINIYRQRVRSQKKILNAIYSTQENERARIGEDIHDSIGANLSALKFRLDGMREDTTDDQTIKFATESMQLLDDVIVNLRQIIRNQSSQYLLSNGFKSELDRFKGYFSSQNKIKMSISQPGTLPELNNNFGINLFRIIQELVNNSVKHSKCSEIIIKISFANGILKLLYSDNGHGFDSKIVREKGMGLSNIDARTQLFNGKYQLDSVPGTTTVYNFEFDYSALKFQK